MVTKNGHFTDKRYKTRVGPGDVKDEDEGCGVKIGNQKLKTVSRK